MTVPDYIFESSWEVCNKIGGIYTVLSSKARTLKDKFGDNLIFIGPDFGNSPDDFKEDDALFTDWKSSLTGSLKIRAGRWLVPGEPIVLLVDFKPFFYKRDALYYEMWDAFQVNSSQAYGDYDESCIFAYTTGLAIESFYRFYRLDNKKVVAQFNEWMLGMGALYLRKYVPAIATVFTTHATTVGRSIAANNKPLYSCMSGYNGFQMAKELNVVAKHSLERQTAWYSDCFTTVSEITSTECKQLLDKAPDIVTPNGFEQGFVPENGAYTEARIKARKLLFKVTEKLTGHKVADDAFIIATSGRYEYRNKGIDVFIDTMNRLRQTGDNKREIIAFILIPAWVHEARADLKYVLDNDYSVTSPMQTPFLTHWINNMQDDRVANFILSSGFTNAESDKVRIIFVPCYLDGHDGIFNCTYYDLLPGIDATVFASYYEPWGYTPLESLAFGVPTITTDLAGFGMWAKTLVSGKDPGEGVTVVHRTDDNYFDVTHKTSEAIISLMNTKDDMRQRCQNLASKAEWKQFIAHCYAAFDIAFFNANKRINKK